MKSAKETYFSELTEEGHIKVSPVDILQNLFKLGISNQFSIALWRLPQNDSISIIIDTERYEPLDQIDLEEMKKGFLFCPYDQGDRVFIRRHISYSTGRGSAFISTGIHGTLRKKIEDIFEAQTNDNKDELSATIPENYLGLKKPGVEIKKDEYCHIVEDSVNKIKSGLFEKVVPSRTKSIILNDHFDLLQKFLKLSDTYPRSFVYLVAIPDTGTWMGASPEALIEIEEGKKFRTISLAGTQKYDSSTRPESVAWTQKDIEEQALVSRYIINCFKKIRLREFEEKGPKTVIAGKLLHLKTIFEVDMEETGFHNLGTVMLKLLHPTSAVCGMPRETANNYLQEVERHPRKYFCGFLGPVDNSYDTHLYVNLRCMELLKGEATLYAGAGITEDSDPEKEWIETEIKFNTLLDIIN